jgi:hypothetical protein
VLSRICCNLVIFANAVTDTPELCSIDPAGFVCNSAAAAGVPTVWLNLLNHMDKHSLKLRHLQRVCIAGSAPPRSMIQALEK